MDSQISLLVSEQVEEQDCNNEEIQPAQKQHIKSLRIGRITTLSVRYLLLGVTFVVSAEHDLEPRNCEEA